MDKKNISFLLAFLILLQFMLIPSVWAMEEESLDNVVLYKDQYGNIYTEEQYHSLDPKEIEALDIEPSSVSSIAIFFGGMAVGWLVDGVIEYNTGKAPSEWVVLGLRAIERKIKKAPKHVKFVRVYSNGDVAYCYQGGCQVSW